MKQDSSKKMLFEMMNKVGGMPLNEDINTDMSNRLDENYPLGANEDPNAPWNRKDDEDEDNEPDPDEGRDDDDMSENIHNTPQMGGITNSKGIAGYNPDTSKMDKDYANSVNNSNLNSVKHNIGNSIFNTIENQIDDEIYSQINIDADTFFKFYKETLDVAMNIAYEKYADTFNTKAGAAPDEY
ncbi:MAG: hypothetical protein PF487_06840 [Bacteroidales bacterium]|jgi:hypothetical protein|nr:hypothetical protein [Bacteroidales bacterium]